MRNIIKVEKHFVASVWIISSGSPKKVLLVHHKKFNKWLQPGGHVEIMAADIFANYSFLPQIPLPIIGHMEQKLFQKWMR